MKINSDVCNKCGYKNGTVSFNHDLGTYVILCHCKSIKCPKCKQKEGRSPGFFYLDVGSNLPEYIYQDYGNLCKECAIKNVPSGLTGNPKLDYALLFISSAKELQNQTIPPYISIYIASHGFELLLKFILEFTVENNLKKYRHNIKKIYKRLKNIYNDFPINDDLVKRINDNLQNGGIRFYQPNVKYYKTSPVEILEYSMSIAIWFVYMNPLHFIKIRESLCADNGRFLCVLNKIRKIFRIF